MVNTRYSPSPVSFSFRHKYIFFFVQLILTLARIELMCQIQIFGDHHCRRQTIIKVHIPMMIVIYIVVSSIIQRRFRTTDAIRTADNTKHTLTHTHTNVELQYEIITETTDRDKKTTTSSSDLVSVSLVFYTIVLFVIALVKSIGWKYIKYKKKGQKHLKRDREQHSPYRLNTFRIDLCVWPEAISVQSRSNWPMVFLYYGVRYRSETTAIINIIEHKQDD